MIIKSMSRKESSFNQLIDYMGSGRADERFTIHHNIFSRNPDQIKDEFYQNAGFLHRRTGGNYMYHEVISITRSDRLRLDEQKEKLRQIALDYIRDRAENNLAYGALHDDHDNNIHFHLIISANEVHSRNRHRLSKYRFDQIKKDLEKRVLECYPELQQKELINRSAEERISNKGSELKRRTGKTPQRDLVREKVKTIFEQVSTREEFLESFEKAGLNFYIRGKTPGVIDMQTGRKFRIKTLGFLSQYENISQKIEMNLMQKHGHTNYAKAQTQEEEKSTKKCPNITKEERNDQRKQEQMARHRARSQQSAGEKDGHKR